MYVRRPDGVDARQQDVVDAVQALNDLQAPLTRDPESPRALHSMRWLLKCSRACRTDGSHERTGQCDLYGCKPGDGSFASNCLLARRLAERGVRFIQLYHRGWDHHNGLVDYMQNHCCPSVDHAIAGLLTDLKRKGCLRTR